MAWPTDRFTRFEVARLLGARSLQIALGAPILVESEKKGDAIKTAKEEFRNKLIPITVKRRLPDNREMVVNVKGAVDNWLLDHAGVI
jgi:DNA-directed RNA polymerase subunit K